MLIQSTRTRLTRRLWPALVVAALILGPAAALAQAPSKSEAAALLKKGEYEATPQGLLGVLETSIPDLEDVVRAYLALGVPVDRPVALAMSDGQKQQVAPLNYLLRFDCSGEATARVATLLLDAGASPNLRDPGRNNFTPAMAAVRCPAVLAAVLAKKPDLSLTNGSGGTAMHVAISDGDETSVRMIAAAGFDPKPWQAGLLAAARGNAAVTAILTGALVGLPVAAPEPPGAALDWRAPGPFPQRSPTEALALLARPGESFTADEHFAAGISRREPQRLALAIQAGANVRQTVAANGYTPLLLMVDRCDLKDHVAQQVAIAGLLVAAKADVNGVDANKANALVVGARNCPVGVLTALIGAGVSLTAPSVLGETPLRAAIHAARVEVVDVLLDAGVDPAKEPYNVNREASNFANKDVEAALKRRRR